MSGRNGSLLWNYFTERKDEDGKKVAVCKDADKCKAPKKIIKISQGTTSGMDSHLKVHHKVQYQEYLSLKEQQQELNKSQAATRKKQGNRDTPTLLFKQSKLQESFTNTLKYEDVQKDHPVQTGFDSRFVDVIVAAFLPFGFADLPEVHELFNFLNKRITVKCSTTYSRQIEHKYNEAITKIKNIIKTKLGSSCGFTSDLWTSRARNSYMSLTAHFIDSNFNLHRWTPYCKYLGSERHTGEVICKHLDDMVEDLSISDEVKKYCVTDNAANMMKGVRISEINSSDCKNHTLQLAIHDAFDDSPGMSNALQKCKDITTLTHKSEQSEKALLSYCSKFDHSPNTLKQENDTRWNSKYANMASVLHHRDCINNMGKDDKLDHSLVPTLSEWKMIEGACLVLKEFVETTKDWEQEKVPTLNLVAKRLYEKQEKLKSFQRDKTKKGFGITFAKVLAEKLTERFPKLGLLSNEVALANCLDPSIKGVHLMSEGLYETTVEKIEQLAEQLDLIVADGTSDVSMEGETELTALEKLKKKFSNQLDEKISQESPMRRELALYRTLPEPSEENQILDWWKIHEKSLPILSAVARHVLAIPAASSKSERVFSSAGNTVTPKRSRLDADKVEMLVILKQNCRLLKLYE